MHLAMLVGMIPYKNFPMFPTFLLSKIKKNNASEKETTFLQTNLIVSYFAGRQSFDVIRDLKRVKSYMK